LPFAPCACEIGKETVERRRQLLSQHRLRKGAVAMHRTDEQVGSAEAQAAKLRGILESAVTAIITIDDRGLIEAVNPATEHLFGYAAAELIGQNVKVLMPDPYRAEHDAYIRNYLKTGTRKIIGIGREVSGRRKDGATFPIHLAVSEFEAKGRRYFTGMIHDLSDRKHVEMALRESERRLAQAQKMEAVGQLTGGIAHDFNNLLLVITGNLELLETRVGGDDARALLKEAQNAAVLGSQLTEQLLTFARQRQLDPRVVSLNDLVIGVAEMLRRTLGAQISLSTSLASDLWETCADACQLQSAIVNLAVNARDAMPKGGRLIVETRNVTVEADQLGADPELKCGEYVQLSVSDTGMGMPPAVRDRVFEPFFTTKEKGRGTGLGLAMVYGFVKQMGGQASIYSEVGQGTTVNLYLPRAGAPPVERRASQSVAPPDPRSRRVILVVEDDERVRQLTVTRLKMIGHDVIEARDGPEALNLLQSGAHVDLVFTDMIMPGGLSGRDVAHKARDLKPGIKVLLTTGYAEDLAHADDLQQECLKVLRKPYRQAELAMALRDVLDMPLP
jgi:PAS domain S-box-containing protein